MDYSNIQGSKYLVRGRFLVNLSQIKYKFEIYNILTSSLDIQMYSQKFLDVCHVTSCHTTKNKTLN